jgi:hypothetical protein
MKRRGVVPEGCVRERVVPERSVGEERSLKRCDVKNEVSREDIDVVVVDLKRVRSYPSWLIIYVVDLEENEVHSSRVEDTENSEEGTLPEE